MNAAAGKNKLKVLSAPHIMTADNHEAHILVGQEVPIVTTQSNASNDPDQRHVEHPAEHPVPRHRRRS